MLPGVSDFDFSFDGEDRAALLREARKVVTGYRLELSAGGGSATSAPTPAEQAALDLLEGFDHAVAEFSAYPDVIRLEERHFSEHKLPVPTRFNDLNKDHRFYWIRFPTLLKPCPGTVFNKLQCAIHFNPSGTAPHLLPRLNMILPDRKFQEIASAHLGFEVSIGENFEFVAKADLPALPAAEAKAGVEAKQAGKLGLVAGPFRYSWKRAVINHTAPGNEKVFWTLSSSEFAETDELAFIVVLQVPAALERVEVAAAMRACHRFTPASDLGEAFQYLRKRVAEFFKAGAPTNAPTKVWDITPSL